MEIKTIEGGFRVSRSALSKVPSSMGNQPPRSNETVDKKTSFHQRNAVSHYKRSGNEEEERRRRRQLKLGNVQLGPDNDSGIRG